MNRTLPGLARNAVVAASAGTGKTQLLTSIYLLHVLGLHPDGRPLPARKIVATTFSRAAAAEIRERLEARLGRIAASALAPEDPRGLGVELFSIAEERGLSRAELERRARHALEDLGHATIDTLHGLAALVLREHAFELGLAPNFSILDEQQAFEDAERTIDDGLARCLEPSSPLAAGATALLDTCFGLENARGAIIGLFNRLDEEGLDAGELAGGEECAERSKKLAELAVLASRIIALGPSPFYEPAVRIRRVLEQPEPALSALLEALVALAAVRGTAKVRELEGWPLVSEFFSGLGRSSDSRAQGIRALLELLGHAPALERITRDIAGVLGEIQRELRARRLERSNLAFSDLLRLARDGLRDHPEIALRAGAGIELLLVDEFQDTSRVQRDLLLLLRERAESCRARRPGSLPAPSDIQARGLVVVGDRKQSIYSFRGADVSVFARLAAELAGDEAARALHLSGVDPNPEPVADFRTLTDNYRSGPAILEALNAIAHADFDPSPTRSFQIRFSEAEALRSPSGRLGGDPGRVTLIRDDGNVEGLPALLSRAKPALRTAFVAAGFCAQSAREGAAFRDIAVLARRRSTLPLVELALDRLALPFVVSGRDLYATPEVRDLLALLRLALNPRDRHALAVAARGLCGGLSDASLVELCAPSAGLLPASAWQPERLSNAEEAEVARLLKERLLDFTRTAPLISPRDALRLAFRIFEIEQVYSTLPRGQIRLGNVERLSEIAARHGGNLAAFVRWLDRQIQIEADEAEAAVFSEEDDAIRLLTIHASKGLSFPIVLVLDIASPEATSNVALNLLRSEREAPALIVRHRGEHGPVHTPILRRYQDDTSARARAERQRLSYVALTRVERELALVMPASEPREHTLARSLSRLFAESGAPRSGVRELSARTLLDETASFSNDREAPNAAPPPRAPLASCRTATVAATALADFAVCRRRFRLLHLERLEEPSLFGPSESSTDEDPRTLGRAAHRVLERWPLEDFGTSVEVGRIVKALLREGLAPDAPETLETAAGIVSFLGGDFARSLRDPGVIVHRELGLVVALPEVGTLSAAAPKRGAAALQLELFAPRPAAEAKYLLKATLDLAVVRADGSVDVIDYKRSRGGDADRYAFQLAAYKSAVGAEFGASRVRTGLIHLLGRADEPAWQEPKTYDLRALMQALVSARFDGVWPALEKEGCMAARCGFVNACYGAP